MTNSTQLLLAAPDAYLWQNQLGGLWSSAPNWFDTTVGATAVSAPGALNAATINGGTNNNFTNIAGSATAAQLSVNSDVLFLGTAAVGSAVSLGASADLDLDSGARLAAGSLNLGNSALLLAGGGSTVTIAGNATLQAGFLSVLASSSMQVGSLIANDINTGLARETSTIAVDDSSAFEVGTTGGAAIGAITVDAGQSAAISGTLYGNLVINGTLGIQANGALVIDPGDPYGNAQSIGGSGTLLLSETSSLTLGVADSTAIRFGGPAGTLDLIALPTGTITGFATGDVIKITGGAAVVATGLSYKQTSSNAATLTLTKAGQVVGTLALAGNYTGSLFHLGFDTLGNGIITLQTIGSAPVQPSLILGTAGTDTLVPTANNQTLTGFGGNDTFGVSAFTGVTFKDTSTNLNGSTFTAFAASDVLDLTDMNSNNVSVSYVPGAPTATLIMTDGSHTATVVLSLIAALPPGLFTTSTDGAAGSNVKYNAANIDTYVFAATPGGLFGSASNWQDVTTGIRATQAPGFGNAVTIGSNSGYANITGNGVAASLTANGRVLLWDSLVVGSKLSGVSGALTQTGTLALDGTASLVLAGTATVGGLIEIGGGSTLTAAGGISFSASSASVLATGGSSARFTTVFTTVGSSAGAHYVSSVIGVDRTSSIEFGNAGSAVAGAVTIDAAMTVNLAGTIDGNLVVNGTLATAGDLTVAAFGSVAPSVSGSGIIELTYGDTLRLAGSESAAILFSQTSSGSFSSTTETLALGTIMPTATISGFTRGDVIIVGLVVTNLTWNGARLTLLNGGTPVASLALSGLYTANQFQVQLSPDGRSSFITYTATPSTAPGNSVSGNSDSYSWTNSSGGVWSAAANWSDTTTGGLSSAAPGSTNAVTISDDTGPWTGQIIYGPAAAASLTVASAASTVFIGIFSIAGQFAVNNFGSASASVALANSTNLSAGSLSVTSLLRLSNASLLTVLGTTGGTFISGVLTVGSGSAVRVATGASVITGTVAVDATSSIEFGTAGTATSGTLAVDSGQTLTLQGVAAIAADVVINGSLLVYSGTIGGFGGSVGSITGTGVIHVSALGPTGYLVLNATDTVPIVFDPFATGSGTFAVETLELKNPLRTGTITGFIAGDSIVIDRNVTGATFTQTTGAQGTLTLTSGATTVGTLILNGNYAASLFQVDIAPATGIATISLQTAPGIAGTASANTGNHAYNWTGPKGGSWTTAANWQDLSTGIAPTTVPGSGNAVTIVGSIGAGQYATVGGNGAAAALSISGNVLLTGQISVAGTVNVSSGNGPAAALALEAGATLTATGSALLYGRMEVGGGSSATLPGYALLYGGSLLVLGGSTVQVGGLIGDSSGDVIAVDANSVLAIGASTNAAAGALTVGASAPAQFAGLIYASVVLNGALWVSGGGTLFIDLNGTAGYDPYASAPTISGNGLLIMTEGSTLGLGVADAAPILFYGPNATLVLAAIPTATISGFADSDQIQVNQTVTGMTYQQVNGGLATLTLTNGASTVGTLQLAGAYGGGVNAFHLDAAPNGATAVITLQSLLVTPLPMTLIYGSVGSDSLSATANGQTITGQGGGDVLSAANAAGTSFTGISFKDYSFYLSGSEILNFGTTDIVDFIDITAASATATYTGGILSATDGTHAASLVLAFGTTPAAGAFHIANDGSGGSKLTWS